MLARTIEVQSGADNSRTVSTLESPDGRQATREVESMERSFHPVSSAGGIKLIARSASAVMVRLGLTPRLAATTDPSQMYMFV